MRCVLGLGRGGGVAGLRSVRGVMLDTVRSTYSLTYTPTYSRTHPLSIYVLQAYYLHYTYCTLAGVRLPGRRV